MAAYTHAHIFGELAVKKTFQHTPTQQLSNAVPEYCSSIPRLVKDQVCPCLPTHCLSYHGPQHHFLSSLFLELLPFRIWTSVLFLLIYFPSLSFCFHFRMSPHLYLRAPQLRFSLMLSNT